MHAFLIVGKNKDKIDENIEEIISKNKAKIVEQILKTIDDVRQLNKSTRLTLIEPTAYLIKDIDQAGEEALNAFLKNLEEPQEYLFYILTTSNIHTVLPTIISRCQIILVSSDTKLDISKEILEFPNLSVGEKLAYVDTIREREKAVSFIEDYLNLIHKLIHSNSPGLNKNSQNAEVALTTLKYLRANGNVNLQLANFVIQLV